MYLARYGHQDIMPLMDMPLWWIDLAEDALTHWLAAEAPRRA